ncbi:hypothetical protein FMN63_18925 [Stappia sp. BW2]|uniref:hypothetical protein n=1 Tax=Stappia sp. BW2 TaxID=2592622 RepID=UPI0011DE7092|nr:hypothetical protein [Stappia sp. BW2]TYC64556.1 hypothetical protein FMN63_18925 [Stappia sp. BW2]
MRYLTVDGMSSGTGVRDTLDGGFVDLDKIGVSAGLKRDVRVWLLEYEADFFAGFRNLKTLAALDEKGLQIAQRLSKEIPGSKIEYYSDGKSEKIYFKL